MKNIFLLLVILCVNIYPQPIQGDCDSCAILKGKVVNSLTKEGSSARIMFSILPESEFKKQQHYFVDEIENYTFKNLSFLTFTDNDGNYEVRLLPGDYIIIVFGDQRRSFPPREIKISILSKENKILDIDFPGSDFIYSDAAETDSVIEYCSYFIALENKFFTLQEFKDKTKLLKRFSEPFRNSEYFIFEHPYTQGVMPHSDTYRTKLCYMNNSVQTIYRDSLVQLFNQQMKNENYLTAKQIIELAELYFQLYTDGYNKILNSWKEIKYSPRDTVTDNIKKLINPPRFLYTPSGYHLVFYGIYGCALKEYHLFYSNKTLKIDSKFIGTFGYCYVVL
jgi:hypothetical protein